MGIIGFDSRVWTNMNQASIVAVVVLYLYKRLPEQSSNDPKPGESFCKQPRVADSLQVILFDNSPKALEQVSLTIPCKYRHAGRNVGTSGAYNYAMELASGGISLAAAAGPGHDDICRVSSSHVGIQPSAPGPSEVGTVVPFVHSHG